MPGVSRSGATICAGLLRDMERREAATFAFLLSAPVIAGAGLKQLVTVAKEFADGTLHGEDFVFFATGFVCSAIVGWFTIRFLLAYLTTNSLRAFVVYRVGSRRRRHRDRGGAGARLIDGRWLVSSARARAHRPITVSTSSAHRSC